MPKINLVIDSSVIVKWLNSQDELYLRQADQLLSHCQGGKVELNAPELAKYEVGNALLHKGLSLPQLKASLITLYSLPINFISSNAGQAQTTAVLAYEGQITYYDAAFVDLAQYLSATLITDNPKHQDKFSKIKIIPLKNYK